MASFGGFSNDPLARARFQCYSISARHGGIEIGIVKFTPHSRVLVGDSFGHGRQASRLMVLLDGAQTISAGNSRWTLTRGAGLLIPGDASASYKVETVTTHLYIDLPADDPEFGPLRQNVRWGSWPMGSPSLAAVSAFVGAVLQHGGPGVTPIDWAQARGTLDLLVCATISSALPAESSPLSPRKRALQYIRTHYTNPELRPCGVAAGIGVSVRTLQRAFAGGPNAHEWLMHCRLRHALGLLQDPQFVFLPVSQIAVRSGFGSTITMRRAVTAATGLPPGAYRVSLGLTADRNL